MTFRDGRLGRRMTALVAIQILWLGIVCALGVWWERLLLQQAARIDELEARLGFSGSEVLGRTQNMLRWESFSFFALLILATGLLFWMYSRDGRRVRSLEAFFASVTHELRTPLTSIRLQSESLLDALKHGEKGEHLVQRLLEDTSFLENQVNRILELSRLEGGAILHPQEIRLAPWFERVARDWREAFGSQVTFHLDVRHEFTIQADPTAMEVIFRNLIENSIRHSKLSHSTIHISAQAHPRGVEIRVRDQGVGVEASSIPSLGKLFHKGKTSSGAGVGLYLVSTLIRKMGGSVAFQSAAAGGFEALFTLKSSEAGREGGAPV